MAERIVKCQQCGENKPLAAYGLCGDCFDGTGQRYGAGYVMEHAADGTPLCRFCKQRVTAPRRKTFCSELCVHEWQVRSNVQYARGMVFLRDQGICIECGLDTVELEQQMIELRTADPDEWERQWAEMISEGWDPKRKSSLWDADHIKPIAEGGGLCGLENMRTLCIPCHRTHTNDLKKRLAIQRRKGTTNGRDQD